MWRRTCASRCSPDKFAVIPPLRRRLSYLPGLTILRRCNDRVADGHGAGLDEGREDGIAAPGDGSGEFGAATGFAAGDVASAQGSARISTLGCPGATFTVGTGAGLGDSVGAGAGSVVGAGFALGARFDAIVAVGSGASEAVAEGVPGAH